MKWFLEDEVDRRYSLAILEALSDNFWPVVPVLWYYEIANTIQVQVRRQRIVKEDAVAYLGIIEDMAIEVDPHENSRCSYE